MPPKNKNRDFQKHVLNPYQNKNLGRRTGKDIKAGKNIRITDQGFENFDDYWSESEVELTKDGTFLLESAPPAVVPPAGTSVSFIKTASQLPPPPTVPTVHQDVTTASHQSVLAQSQVGNMELGKSVMNPYLNKQIGRRTGKDIKAGKNIRIMENGFENFDDYWSESDADSIASFSTLSVSIHKAATGKRSTDSSVLAKEDRSIRSKDSTLFRTLPSSLELENTSSKISKTLEGHDTETGGDTVSELDRKDGRQSLEDRQRNQKEGQKNEGEGQKYKGDGQKNQGDRQNNQDVKVDAGESSSQEEEEIGEDKHGDVNLSKRKAAIENEVPWNKKASDVARTCEAEEDQDCLGGKEDCDVGMQDRCSRKEDCRVGKDACQGLDDAEDEDTAGSGKNPSKTMFGEDGQTQASDPQERISKVQPEKSGMVSVMKSKSRQGKDSATKTQIPDIQQDSTQLVKESSKGVSKQKENCVKTFQGTEGNEQDQSVSAEKTARKSQGLLLENPQDPSVASLSGVTRPGDKNARKFPVTVVEIQPDQPVTTAKARKSPETVVEIQPDQPVTTSKNDVIRAEKKSSTKKIQQGHTDRRNLPEEQKATQEEAPAPPKKSSGNEVSVREEKQTSNAEESEDGAGKEGDSQVSSQGSRQAVDEATVTSGQEGEPESIVQQAREASSVGIQRTQLVSSKATGTSHSQISQPKLATQASLSQTNFIASPLAASQQSSVYLSLAGDITGSITRLSNTASFSPAPRHFGTRKRLSYSGSPSKDQQAKTSKPKMNAPGPVSRNSLKPVTSPIAEDHREGDISILNLQPTTTENVKQPEDELHHESAAAGETHQQAESEAAKGKNTKQQPLTSQLDAWSEPSVSELGMFVSLANQSRNKTNATHISSLFSNSDDDEFDILDEIRVYHSKIKGAKTKTGAGQKKAAGKGTVSDSKGVKQTSKASPGEAIKRRSSSSNDDVSASPSITKTQTEKSRKAGGKKSTSSNDANTPQVDSKTQKKMVTKKDGQVSRKKSSEVEDKESYPVDDKTQTEKSRKAGGKKSSSSDDANTPQVDSETQKKTATKKDRQVSRKKSLVVEDEESYPVDNEDFELKKKQKKEKKVTGRKKATAELVDGCNEESPQIGEVKVSKGEKVATKKPLQSREAGEESPPAKKQTRHKKTKKDIVCEPASSTEETPDRADNMQLVAQASNQTEEKPNGGRKRPKKSMQGQTVEEKENPQSVLETGERNKRQKKIKGETSSAEDEVEFSTNPEQMTPETCQTEPKPKKTRQRSKSVSEGQASEETEAPERETVKRNKKGKKSKVETKTEEEADSEVDAKSPVAAKSSKQQKAKTTGSAAETHPESKTAGRKSILKRKAKQMDDIEDEEPDTATPENVSPSRPKKAKSSPWKGARQSVQPELSAQKSPNQFAKSSRKTGKRRLTLNDMFIDGPNTQVVHVDVHAEDMYALSPDVEAKRKNAAGTATSKRKSGAKKGRASRNAKGLAGCGQSLTSGTSVSKPLTDIDIENNTVDKDKADTVRKTERTSSAKARKNAAQLSPSQVSEETDAEEQVASVVSSGEQSGEKSKRLSGMTHETTPASNGHRVVSPGEDQVNLENEAARGEMCTPMGQSLSHLDLGDSALKSGISFRRFSKLPSSLKAKRPCQFTSDVQDDIISTPPHCYKGRQSHQTPVSGHPVLQLSRLPQTSGKGNKKNRRVTINNTVTHHNLTPDDQDRTPGDTTVLPSMSATPVHYHQMASPATRTSFWWEETKIVHPDENVEGLRRSQRTRVKPLEWYKNERIIYDRRQSGPVIMAVQPSREHLYLAQDNLKRKRRQQRKMVTKKQAVRRSMPGRRLSTHVPVPSNLNMTVSTDIPVMHPDTRQEVLMGCFNPVSAAIVIGPQGNEPSSDDPFTLKLMGEQKLFSTGILTLAPVSEKPLQRAVSTAVLYSVTYGKIVVTINRATAVMETGDHFFVPRGTVYSLKNLRTDQASLSFVNLMVDNAEEPPTPSVRQGSRQATPTSTRH